MSTPKASWADIGIVLAVGLVCVAIGGKIGQIAIWLSGAILLIFVLGNYQTLANALINTINGTPGAGTPDTSASQFGSF